MWAFGQDQTKRAYNWQNVNPEIAKSKFCDHYKYKNNYKSKVITRIINIIVIHWHSKTLSPNTYNLATMLKILLCIQHK
jgi:hypothetical protein